MFANLARRLTGLQVPDNITSEAAAALGVAVITCGQGTIEKDYSRKECLLTVWG